MNNNRIKNGTNESDQKKHIQVITRLNNENLQLENKYKLISSKLKNLEHCIKNLNHDLRSPLGGITGMIDLMLMNDKDQIEVQALDLIMIRESVQSILNLINGTLIARGPQKSSEENMNIDRILSSVILEINRLYLPMAQNKGISLSLSTQIDTEVPLPPNFFTNLIQITGNLVANAIKFTPSNGTVEVIFTLDKEDEDQHILQMTVTDTGRSMSPDQVSSFNQGKPVERSMGTNGEQGYGIGLQHVIEMVSEDEGQIFVKSRRESGTEFLLSFPLPRINLTRKSTSHFIIQNGAISYNGQHT